MSFFVCSAGFNTVRGGGGGCGGPLSIFFVCVFANAACAEDNNQQSTQQMLRKQREGDKKLNDDDSGGPINGPLMKKHAPVRIRIVIVYLLQRIREGDGEANGARSNLDHRLGQVFFFPSSPHDNAHKISLTTARDMLTTTAP